MLSQRNVLRWNLLAPPTIPRREKWFPVFRRGPMKSNTNSMRIKKVPRECAKKSKVVRVATTPESFVVEDQLGVLSGRHYSQLAYWGFSYDPQKRTFIGTAHQPSETLEKLLP